MIPSASFAASPNSRSDSLSRAADAGPRTGNAGGSIRPRNRRLVSTEQELVATSSSSKGADAGVTSRRGVSPIPQKHPSRGPPSGGEDGRNGSSTPGGSVRGRKTPAGSGRPVGGLLSVGNEGGRGSPVTSSGGGLFDGGWMSSWSTLQGIASSVLGGNGGGVAPSVPGTKSKSKAWGPESLPKQYDGDIGQGSTAERDAAVRRKKLARALEGREERPTLLDTNGNYKHRTSTEEERPVSSQDDQDALVYIHHVQPNDTLAGVVLRYNCQPAVFRKANRFWPNDSIQIRKTVILPIDACTIKGRPCGPPSPGGSGVDLLAPTPGIEDPPPFINSSWPPASSAPKNGIAAADTDEEEKPWTHVRWVLIDSSPNSKPVEIARMPRKTLGYFPPRRRKSQNTISTVSTPRGSSDFSHLTQSLATDSIPSSSIMSTPPTRRTSNLGPRPSQSIISAIPAIPGSYFPPPSMTTSLTRPRGRSINSSTSDTPSAAAIERYNFLRGPGGVGTLSGKNVRTPGPGKDGMNSWVKKHLPYIAIDSLPSSSIQGAETAHFGFDGELASIAEGPAFNNPSNDASGVSTPLLGSNGLGIENAAAAIEGWMRRLAVKAPGTPRSGATGIGIGRGESDLIELLDGAGSDDGRGFELNPSSERIRTETLAGTGREDLDSIVRGRATGGAKGGKSD